MLQVETPQDQLVMQLCGAYSVGSMLLVNSAYLASGSLAVSFATAWMCRVWPLLVVEFTKRREGHADEAGDKGQ